MLIIRHNDKYNKVDKITDRNTMDDAMDFIREHNNPEGYYDILNIHNNLTRDVTIVKDNKPVLSFESIAHGIYDRSINSRLAYKYCVPDVAKDIEIEHVYDEDDYTHIEGVYHENDIVGIRFHLVENRLCPWVHTVPHPNITMHIVDSNKQFLIGYDKGVLASEADTYEGFLTQHEMCALSKFHVDKLEKIYAKMNAKNSSGFIVDVWSRNEDFVLLINCNGTVSEEYVIIPINTESHLAIQRILA